MTITDRSIPACFERIAARYPNRIAVARQTSAITYAELNAAANRLADQILPYGGPGDRVAILMPQDEQIFVAMIAGLKAARIVLILNPDDPHPRLRQLLNDAEPGVILTNADHVDLARQLGRDNMAVVRVDKAENADNPGDPKLDIRPDDIALLVYTSGSTGQPKGVMQTHGHTLRDAADATSVADIGPQDRVLLLASLWGAQAVSTTWLTLANGATLMSFPAVESGTTGLAQWLIAKHVTVFVAAASLFRHFVRSLDPSDRFPDIRLVKLSADAATDEDLAACRRHMPVATLMNVVGCSEVGHIACAMFPPGVPAGEGRLPVGRPIGSIGLRLLDEEGDECPPGVPGTMEVRARYLAGGYWRDPDLTAQCFSVEPDGMRVFRGGDLAIMDDQGTLTHAGRKDAAFKIRGQRVDLAEVEEDLSKLGGVGDVAVVAVPRQDGALQLVAHIVPGPGSVLSSQKMRTAARTTMPRHLIPAAFVFHRALPRSANGKVDRKQLRDHTLPTLGATHDPPVSDVEVQLAGIWQEAFDLDGIGRRDDFFELGGDSLIATVIAARLYAAVGITFDFATFVDHPVLKDQAAFAERLRPTASEARAPPLVPVERRGDVPLAASQVPYWRDSRVPRHAQRHTRSAGGWLEGPLDVACLRQSLNDVVARHEMLRTRFVLVDGEPVQQVEPAGPVTLPLVDLSDDADPRAAAEAFVDREGERPFDLTEGPPRAFSLLRLRPDLHVLVEASHHIILDGPSWNVFVRDLAQAYEARRAGQESPLLPPAVQFADYCLWQQPLWQPGSARFQERMDWWRNYQARELAPIDLTWLQAYRRREPARDLKPSDWQFTWGFDAETSDRLAKVGQAASATYYMVRLATVVPILAMASGADRVALSTVFTNRNRIELEDMFGPLVTVAAVASECDWDRSFADLCVSVRDRILEVGANVDILFSRHADELQGQNGVSALAPFWVHMPTPVRPLQFGELKLSWKPMGSYPNQPRFMIRFDESDESRCTFHLDARVYATEALRGLADCLADFTRAAARNPEASLGSLIQVKDVAARLRAPHGGPVASTD